MTSPVRLDSLVGQRLGQCRVIETISGKDAIHTANGLSSHRFLAVEVLTSFYSYLPGNNSTTASKTKGDICLTPASGFFYVRF